MHNTLCYNRTYNTLDLYVLGETKRIKKWPKRGNRAVTQQKQEEEHIPLNEVCAFPGQLGVASLLSR